MDNMEIYNKVKSCPSNALKPIQGGKLKGMSDINPMWRIKMLTEVFGPCGIGWKVGEVMFFKDAGANNEISAWCRVNLYVNHEGKWSEPIEGIGGSMLVSTEKGKLVTNDEAYKMAYTDALGVCCKMLGFAADVYWNADSTKYTNKQEEAPAVYVCADCGDRINGLRKQNGKMIYPDQWASYTKSQFGRSVCVNCWKRIGKKAAENDENHVQESESST